MGYGRHFLQLAYVNANRNFEDIPDEEFANFSLDNPLGALLGRSFQRNPHQMQETSKLVTEGKIGDRKVS